MLALVAVLCGCQTSPPGAPQAPGGGTARAPAAEAPPLPAAPAYRVVPEASEVRILAYRGGPLARFGHNHVIVGPVHGEIRTRGSAAETGFRLEIAVDELQVDPPAARAEEGEAFTAEVSDQARSGTRDNLLGPKVLDAVESPRILIASVRLEGPWWNPEVTANVTLRGVTSTVEFPAAVFQQGDRLTVVARLSLTQSALGLTPFSMPGGALTVEDRMVVRIRVVAEAAAESG